MNFLCETLWSLMLKWFRAELSCAPPLTAWFSVMISALLNSIWYAFCLVLNHIRNPSLIVYDDFCELGWEWLKCCWREQSIASVPGLASQFLSLFWTQLISFRLHLGHPRGVDSHITVIKTTSGWVSRAWHVYQYYFHENIYTHTVSFLSI